MNYKVEALAEDNNLCGEAPTWIHDGNCLVWTDLGNSLVYKLDMVTGVKTIISRGLMVAGIALNFDGRFVFAGATGLHLWNGQDDYQTILFEHGDDKLFFNDILADPLGRLYAGTRCWNPNGVAKLGKLYFVGTDGSVGVVDEGFELVNGMGLDPQNNILYVTDTLIRTIYAYDLDRSKGFVSNKRVFVRVPNNEGLPDGLTVDAQGCIWSAQYFGGEIVRYAPEGKVLNSIRFPAKQITSMCFGGRNMTDLYVTSASETGPPGYAPTDFDYNAPKGGSLYRIHTNVVGKGDFRTRFSMDGLKADSRAN